MKVTMNEVSILFKIKGSILNILQFFDEKILVSFFKQKMELHTASPFLMDVL